MVPLAFVFATECKVEGTHALVKRMVQRATRHSVAYVSLGLQLPDFTEAVADVPNILQQLAGRARVFKTCQKALNALGLEGNLRLQVQSARETTCAPILFNMQTAPICTSAVLASY